jgi:hypothetical protein
MSSTGRGWYIAPEIDISIREEPVLIIIEVYSGIENEVRVTV